TSSVFIEALKRYEVKISMDGKGRALDNIYTERFWGSLNREKIYLNPTNGGVDLYRQVKDYVRSFSPVDSFSHRRLMYLISQLDLHSYRRKPVRSPYWCPLLMAR